MDQENSLWWSLPEPMLLNILSKLSVKDVLSAGSTCKRWNIVANDNYLWRKMFRRDFKVDPTIGLKPGAESWNSEYKRLVANIPLVLTQILTAHTNQVLHVSFSHNGEMFATCSKDGNVIIWNSSNPCTVKYSHNMKNFSWKYTQYSQFNQSDTLLLVSGIHFGSPHSTSGEIAVFTVENKSYLRCRVVNRPYDIFGAWFSDQYLISGHLHWLAHLVSTSVLWLNKANQETDSEHIPIMNQLYKFYNRNASSIRAVMVARCPWLDDSNDPLIEEKPIDNSSAVDTPLQPSTSSASKTGNPVSHLLHNQNLSTQNVDHSFPNVYAKNADSTIHYVHEFHKKYVDANLSDDNMNDDISYDDSSEYMYDDDDDLENSVPKYLIFSTGSQTYTPHQIGIKRIRNVNFPKKLDPGPSLKERIAAKKRAAEEQNMHPRVEPDWWDYDSVIDRFDKVDRVIDLHGHIIGMALSPDHRYLYVNTRPWPKGYVITNPLEPPPIAQEIDIHVIDLMTLQHVGNMLRAHKAYTPNTECFFIFIDVCDNYVASGAEDMHAYLWDRYYGICLAKYRHDDVVNSVAFNPKDSEMLVTTGDDYSIKIWRSVEKLKQIDKPTNLNKGTEYRNKISL